jgi:hypothetical protein
MQMATITHCPMFIGSDLNCSNAPACCVVMFYSTSLVNALAH